MLRLSIPSVNLSVTSIASFLPSSTGQDEVFAGLTPYITGARPTLSPIQEATFCKQQADKQREDAETRNVVWSGENSLELDELDGECEDDPDYVRLPDGRYEKIDAMSPIGIRNKDGNIEPITCAVPEQPSEAQFGGFSENVPIRLQDIVCFFFPLNLFFSPAEYSYTQKDRRTNFRNRGFRGNTNSFTHAEKSWHVSYFFSTRKLYSYLPALSTLPPSSGDYLMSSAISSVLTPTSSGFDPEMLKALSIQGSDDHDTEMLGIKQFFFPTFLMIFVRYGNSSPASC